MIKFLSPDRKLYHPNNAALGMAAMRAGVNHWQAGQIEIGHGMVCKAYAILMVTHGPTHPITKDLEVNTLNISKSAYKTAGKTKLRKKRTRFSDCEITDFSNAM